MAAVAYRRAALGDASDIHALLLAGAPDIPLLVDTLEREEALYARVRSWARSGESWVAVDASGRIVGAALAERAEHGRHYAEHEVVDLRYAAVAAGAMDNGGILATLLDRLLGGMVPVTATVSPGNRTGLAETLEQNGFRLVASPGGERQYRWQPGK